VIDYERHELQILPGGSAWSCAVISGCQ